MKINIFYPGRPAGQEPGRGRTAEHKRPGGKNIKKVPPCYRGAFLKVPDRHSGAGKSVPYKFLL